MLKWATRVRTPNAEATRRFDRFDEFDVVKAKAAMALAQYYQTIIIFPDQFRTTSRRDALDRAMKNYQVAASAMPDDPLFTGIANLGIATVQEDDGLWDKAKEIYTTLADPKGNSPLAEVAAMRLSSLPGRREARRLWWR